MRLQATSIVALLVQFVRELDLAIAMLVSVKRRDLCPIENVSNTGGRYRIPSQIHAMRQHGDWTSEPGRSIRPTTLMSCQPVSTGSRTSQRG